MTRRIWTRDDDGTDQEVVANIIRPWLKALIRARLCSRCYRSESECSCRSQWLYGAEHIRSDMPAAIVLDGCPEGRMDERHAGHTARHPYHEDSPDGFPSYPQTFVCFSGNADEVTADALAHELAHAFTQQWSHYSENDGRWYAPHGARWQRVFAAMGFPTEAAMYARLIRADDVRVHREWDAEFRDWDVAS